MKLHRTAMVTETTTSRRGHDLKINPELAIQRGVQEQAEMKRQRKCHE
jgi:hypothetical protein